MAPATRGVAEAKTLTNLGHALYADGDLTGAREHWHQAVRILDDLGHPEASTVRATLRDSQQPQPELASGP